MHAPLATADGIDAVRGVLLLLSDFLVALVLKRCW